MFKRLILGLVFLVTLALILPTRSLAQGPMVGSPGTGKIAVTPAGYDDMGAVLKSMGFSPDEIPEEDRGGGVGGRGSGFGGTPIC